MENIRLNLSQNTHSILLRDLNYFKIKNLNELCNRIIRNYSKNFPIDQDKYEKIIQILRKHFSDGNIAYALEDIIRLELSSSKKKHVKPHKSINIKVQEKNMQYVSFLKEDLSKSTGIGLGTLVRDLITSFTELRLIEKESVVYHELILDLQIAIDKQYEVSIKYKNEPLIIRPLLIVTPIDDFSYFLIADTVPAKGDIKNIPILKLTELEYQYTKKNSPFSIGKELSKKIEKFKKDGVTVYNKGEAEIIKRAFSHKGYGFAIPYIIENLRYNYLQDEETKIKA